MPARSKIWTRNGIDTVKAYIKRELDEIELASGKAARLAAILERIKPLAEQIGAEESLELWVLVISALVHHERHGGLVARQITQLTDLGYAVLTLQGISPATSDLSFLYGELHLILSQIQRRAGRHMRSLWEQQVALLLGKQPVGGKAFQSLALGIRLQRLGHLTQALAMFEEAEGAELAQKEWELARINRVRILRLLGRLDEASAAIADGMKRPQSDRTQREFQWEDLQLATRRDRNPGRLIHAVKPKSSHYQYIYVAETIFWLHAAAADQQWHAKLPKVATMMRKADFFPKRSRALVRVLQTLEELRDGQIPFVTRLRALGDIVTRTHRQLAIDHELLILLAAAQWLIKSRSYTLATTTLLEYRLRSLTMSAGANDDVLGLASDLYQRPWFKS